MNVGGIDFAIGDYATVVEPHLRQWAALMRATFPDASAQSDANAEGDTRDADQRLLEDLCGLYDARDISWLAARDASTGDLIGACCCLPLTAAMMVFNLCVLPERRRHGTATMLLRLCGAEALRRGLHAGCGTVDTGDARLRALYEHKLGAAVQANWSTSSDGSAPKSVRLVKQIAPADVAPFGCDGARVVLVGQ
eukprot:m51a1_g11130 hypothetical protein (195) ;mRNA; f:150208-151143